MHACTHARTAPVDVLRRAPPPGRAPADRSDGRTVSEGGVRKVCTSMRKSGAKLLASCLMRYHDARCLSGIRERNIQPICAIICSERIRYPYRTVSLTYFQPKPQNATFQHHDESTRILIIR